jgi:hypothetical protein
MKAKKTSAARKPDPQKAVRKILGASAERPLDPSILNAAPKAKLLEACRLLGLRGTSRLPKEEVVDRLLAALQAQESAEVEKRAPRPPVAGAEPPPAAEPAVAEHASRSRAEFQAHKFALTEERVALAEPSREPAPPRYIPWGYGRDRVRALAVDPERLFVYWEVTDEGRERARTKLGAGAPAAWLSLRVYDTTGRLFDGTNAHSYFDHRADDGANGSRQWFFDIGKPGSDAFVEIGMKSHEGYFVRIARSGRVSFPRRSPAPFRRPQWLTVRALSEPPAVAERVPEPDVQRVRLPRVAVVEPARVSERPPAVVELAPPPATPERGAFETWEERRVESRWELPVATHFWEESSSTLPVDVPGPVWETGSFEASTFEVDGRTHVVFGPWQVVVRGLRVFEYRRVLSRWMVYRSWAVESGREAPLEALEARMLGSSAFWGASERRFRGGSELRLAGASELLYRGASERRFGGASERVYLAASERLLRGASERRYLGASEKLFRGASQGARNARLLGGPSGRR